MTSDIGYALLLGSMGLIILTAVVTMIVPPRGPREKKRREQRAALTGFFGAATGSALEVDWFRFGEVPKDELIQVASAHDWRFDADQITATAWILRFTKSP